MRDTTFIKITNQDIYDSIKSLGMTMKSVELHVKETNGKVKMNTWSSRIALVLSFSIIATFSGIKIIGGLF